MSIREIYVDSRRRNTGEHGNSYVLHIQTPLKNISRVELVAATVPNTVYNITNGSNVFTVSAGGSDCSIQNGFYSVSSLVNSVNDMSTLGNTRLTFLSNEGKFMFYSNVAFDITVNSLEFSRITGITSTSSQIAPISLGLTYTGKYVIKSPSVANLKASGEYVYLDIEELRRPFAIDAVTNVYNSQSSTIFAVIPLDVSSGCLKTFKEQSDYKISVEYPKPLDSIDRLTLHWRNYDGSLINFNGVEDNSLILRFYEEIIQQLPSIDDKKSSNAEFIYSKPDKKMVFILLIISLVFILFIKRR
jgi:hypothetical protein